jgi:hypothetical protein
MSGWRCWRLAAAVSGPGFRERGSLWTGQPEARLQKGFQDAVLCQHVLIVQEQFLVDDTGHVGQKTGDAGDTWLQTPS